MSLAKRHAALALLLLGDRETVLATSPSDGYDVAVMPDGAADMSAYVASKLGNVTTANVPYEKGASGQVRILAVRARKASRMVSEPATTMLRLITDSGGDVVRRPEPPFNIQAYLADGGAVVCWQCDDIGGADEARLDGFMVYYGREGCGASGYIEITDGNARSVELTSSHLQAGVRNWINVQAVGAHGCADGNSNKTWVSSQSIQPPSLASSCLVAEIEV